MFRQREDVMENTRSKTVYELNNLLPSIVSHQQLEQTT